MATAGGWVRYTTPEGDEYYHNEITDETSWELPPELLQPTPAPAAPPAAPPKPRKPPSVRMAPAPAPAPAPAAARPPSASAPAQVSEDFEKLRELERIFDDGSKLIKNGRGWCCEGELNKMCRRGFKPFFFILVTDALIYAERSRMSAKFVLRHELPLASLRVSDVPEGDFRCCFKVQSPERSFLAQAEDGSMKQTWMQYIITAQMSAGVDPSRPVAQPFAPVWIPDSATTQCKLCNAYFSLTKRRHHCRNCGDVVCAECSYQRLRVPHVDARKLVRVCNGCASELKGNAVNGEPATAAAGGGGGYGAPPVQRRTSGGSAGGGGGGGGGGYGAPAVQRRVAPQTGRAPAPAPSPSRRPSPAAPEMPPPMPDSDDSDDEGDAVAPMGAAPVAGAGARPAPAFRASSRLSAMDMSSLNQQMAGASVSRSPAPAPGPAAMRLPSQAFNRSPAPAPAPAPAAASYNSRSAYQPGRAGAASTPVGGMAPVNAAAPPMPGPKPARMSVGGGGGGAGAAAPPMPGPKPSRLSARPSGGGSARPGSAGLRSAGSSCAGFVAHQFKADICRECNRPQAFH